MMRRRRHSPSSDRASPAPLVVVSAIGSSHSCNAARNGRLELFVPGRAARRIIGQHLGRDLQLLGDERERRIGDQFARAQQTAGIAQRA